MLRSSRGNAIGCPTMSAVPTANRGRSQDDKGPWEQLLEYNEQILELIGLYIATDLTWRKVNLRAVWWPMVFVLLGMAAYLAVDFLIVLFSDETHEGSDKKHEDSFSVARLELELELAQERKRLRAASLNLELHTRQLMYRDDVPQEIVRYRDESRYYRRIHNTLQGIIIIGALAASTLTGLVQSVPQLRWFAVGTSFAVGVSAGFTGYFKYRERSFYLQETSDSIEQELSAVNLGIARYKNKPEVEALTEFTEQIEILKIEQRKRQQQLEQPSEGRESVQ
jgi:hypothetical protein